MKIKIKIKRLGSRLRGNAVKDFVVDLARDPRTFVDDGNSGEFHYSSEPPENSLQKILYSVAWTGMTVQ